MQICLCIFATSHVQHFEPVVIAIVIAIPIVVVGVTTIITVGVGCCFCYCCQQRLRPAYLLALDVDVAVLADHALGGDAEVLRAVRVPPVLQPALLVVLATCATHSYSCTEGSNLTHALKWDTQLPQCGPRL